ncbi:MAG: hypothetical protein KGI07_09560 [Thaumarchaeota archaeon]|nr:hypothetical protein [Nitrososphaerota archaeon]
MTSSDIPTVICFGTRKILHQNFSRLIAVPKIALKRWHNPTHVKVELVEQNNERFIKLTPIENKDLEDI